MGSSFDCFLTPGNAVKSAYDGPFREQFGLTLEVARLPVFRQVVLVRIVFGEPTAREINIPEISRGDRVSPGSRRPPNLIYD